MPVKVKMYIDNYTGSQMSIPSIDILYKNLGIGAMLGSVFAIISRICGKLNNKSKAYIWIAGIVYPGFTVLFIGLISIICPLTHSWTLFFVGNLVSFIITVICTGCAIIGS